MTIRRQRAPFVLSAVLLAALVFAALGRLGTHEFVQWDDPVTIAVNPAFNPPSFGKIARYWWTPEQSLYIPLTYAAWGALAYVGHVDHADQMGSTLNPWVYHSANVLIHLATTLVVFAMLRRLLDSCSRRACSPFDGLHGEQARRLREGRAREFPALIGAAIFAVHPVQVESVAWASGTKDLLCGLFIAITIHALVRYRHDRERRDVGFCWIATLLACLSKPTGIVAPFMAIAVDAITLRTPLRRSLITLLPGLLIAVVFVVIGVVVQPPLMADVAPLWARPLVAGDALAFYLAKLTWPVNLSADYGRTPQVATQAGWTAWTWIVPAVLGVILWRVRRRTPMIVAGALIALIGVAPVLGLVPFTFQAYSTVADHYLYPSMIEVALAVTGLLTIRDLKMVRIAAVSIVLALATLSFFDAGDWRDSSRLFTHVLEVNPRSFAAYTNRAVDRMNKHDDDGAFDDLTRAVAIDNDYAFAHLNLAELLLKRGDRSAAASELQEVLRIYSRQRNFDPQLAAGVAGRLRQLRERPAPTKPAG